MPGVQVPLLLYAAALHAIGREAAAASTTTACRPATCMVLVSVSLFTEF